VEIEVRLPRARRGDKDGEVRWRQSLGAGKGKIVRVLRAADRERFSKIDNDQWRSPFCRRTLFVDPSTKGTPEEITRFQLFLALWQEGMIDTKSNDFSEAWWRPLRNTFRCRDDGLFFDALDRVRANFAYPDDWRGVRKYVCKVLRNLRSPKSLERSCSSIDEPKEYSARSIICKDCQKPFYPDWTHRNNSLCLKCEIENDEEHQGDSLSH